MRILKDLLGRVFRHSDGGSRRRVSEWELLVHTRQFSYEWQIQDLQNTENERVRKSQKEKKLQMCTLHHKARIVYEWQRKDLGESCEKRMARNGGRPGWLASGSCKSVARTELTVNNYYLVSIIRMILGLEVGDSRGDSRSALGKGQISVREKWVLGLPSQNNFT